MRKAIRWALALSTLVTAGSLLWPDDAINLPSSLAASSRTLDLHTSEERTPPSASPATAASAQSPRPLPSTLTPAQLQPTKLDPFASVALPTTVLTKETPPPPQPVVTPPPMGYRYLGQMVDPQGRTFVYLAKADKEYPARVGTEMDDGYVVEAVTATSIRMRHTASGARADVAIPPSKDSAP